MLLNQELTCITSMKLFSLLSALILIGAVFPAHGQDKDSYEVYLVKLGWHSTLVFKVSDINTEDWPEISRWNHYRYVHVGWGDETFYQSSDDLALLAVRAVLLPTQSVIRIAGFYSPPEEYFGKNRSMVRLRISSFKYSLLIQEISGCFLRDEENQIISSIDYGHPEQFFLSCETYHFFRNCNTWMAKRLRAAGLPMRKRLILTSGQLLREADRSKSLMQCNEE